MNAIEKAVAPLKDDAIERARQEGLAEVEAARVDLEANGWDITKAAPYPKTMGPDACHGVVYYVRRAKYTRYHSITSEDESLGYQSRTMNAPLIVVMDDKKAAKYVERRMEDAAIEYDLFVKKLVLKIGAVKTAVLHGNHVWGFSTLIVTKAKDITEAWHTKQIVNCSKLGKLFNQWPTRKLKKVPVLAAEAADAAQ